MTCKTGGNSILYRPAVLMLKIKIASRICTVMDRFYRFQLMYVYFNEMSINIISVKFLNNQYVIYRLLRHVIFDIFSTIVKGFKFLFYV